MNTDKTWQVKSPNGEVQGPFTDAQILQLLKNGSVSALHELRNATRTKGAWVSATKIPGVAKILEGRAGNNLPRTDPPNPPSDFPSVGLGGSPSVDLASLNLPSDIPNWTASAPAPSHGMPATTDYWVSAAQSLAGNSNASNARAESTKKSKDSLSGHSSLSANSLLEKVDREQRESEQKQRTQTASDYRMHITIGCCAVLLGIFGSYGAFVLSKPLKLRWAANDALSTMVNSMRLAEILEKQRLEKLARNGDRNLRSPSSSEVSLLESARSAAFELQSILDQMPPDLREAWQAEQIELLTRAKFKRNNQANTPVPDDPPPAKTVTTPKVFEVDWSSLSGPYEIGNKQLAKLAMGSLKSKQIAASGVTGANTAEMDLEIVTVFESKGFIAAEMSFEAGLRTDRQTLIIGRITSVTKSTPESNDIITANLKPGFEKILAELTSMAVPIVLENKDLTSIEMVRNALKNALVSVKPKDFKDYSEVKRKLGAKK